MMKIVSSLHNAMQSYGDSEMATGTSIIRL